jgi:hypothetical protein
VCQEIASRGYAPLSLIRGADQSHFEGFEKFVVVRKDKKWAIEGLIGLENVTYATQDAAEAALSNRCEKMPRPVKHVSYNPHLQMHQLNDDPDGVKKGTRWESCCPNLEYIPTAGSYYINGAPQKEIENYWSYKMLDYIERTQGEVGCSGRPFGCTFSTRGETSALAIVQAASGAKEYIYFDSHGSGELLGNGNSYMLRFPNKHAAAVFLNRRYAFRNVAHELGAFRSFVPVNDQSDLNKISINFAVLKEKLPAQTPPLLAVPKEEALSPPASSGGSDLINALGKSLDSAADPKGSSGAPKSSAFSTVDRKADKPVSKAKSVLDFYKKNMAFESLGARKKLGKEVTLEAILQRGERNMEAEFNMRALSQNFFEGEHDYIQRLFPYEEAGGINVGAPVVDQATVQAFKTEPALRANMLRSLDVMLSFYGLKRDVNGFVTISKDPKTFAIRSPNWLTAPTRVHNHQRLDRMIRSLRLLGFEEEAQALFACLLDIAANEGKGKISAETVKNYWTLHATESLEGIAKRVSA